MRWEGESGPLSDTPSGSSASAGLPHSGHSSRRRRHSRTSGTITGSSHR
jgi:hypothetical protein